jgi:hypothetical protein
MAEIIVFPTREARDRAGYERVIREELRALGHDQELIDHVAKKVLSVFDKVSGGMDVTFPEGCRPYLAQIEREICAPFRDKINCLLTEITGLEIRLVELARTKGSPWNA